MRLYGMLLTLPLVFLGMACSDEIVNPDDPEPEQPEQPNQPSDPEPTPDPEPEPDPTPFDLSETEMANCYIVQSPGIYKFKADNRFNQGEGLPVPPEINPASAALLWQSAKGLLTSVELVKDSDTPYITFEVAEAKGNALIAALDESGAVAWSWHIWMPETAIESLATATGYEVMNLNLGALNNNPGEAPSYGMLYQWGRKDPFPAAETLTGNTSTVGAPLYDMEGNEVKVTNSSWSNLSDNTMEFSISNPTVVLSNYAQSSQSKDWLRSDLSDDALWGNPDGAYRDSNTNSYPNKGRKTCYDPSPAGWRVAPADAFRNFTISGGYTWELPAFMVADMNNDGEITLDDFNYGWHFMVDDEHSLYFPAATRYDGSYAMLMGSMSGLWGNYWSNAAQDRTAGSAVSNLSFQVKGMNGEDWVTVSPVATASRADAYSIRCIRDN